MREKSKNLQFLIFYSYFVTTKLKSLLNIYNLKNLFDNQIWLNLLMDNHQFGWKQKFLKKQFVGKVTSTTW
jgi:hypothetical protein